MSRIFKPSANQQMESATAAVVASRPIPVVAGKIGDNTVPAVFLGNNESRGVHVSNTSASVAAGPSGTVLELSAMTSRPPTETDAKEKSSSYFKWDCLPHNEMVLIALKHVTINDTSCHVNLLLCLRMFRL